MGKKEERLNKIVELLMAHSYISIKDLAVLLGVSEMTIRRDLHVIEDNGFAKNVNGMLIYNADNKVYPLKKEYNLSEEVRVQNKAKEAIGRFAASLLEPDDVVIFDTGSTTGQIAPFIEPDLELSVLCFNINILMQVRQNPNIKIAFAGGFYHPNTQMVESPEGINFIRSIRANKLFISAAGVHEELGLTCINNYEVPTKRAILQSAMQHILVVDSGKFGSVYASYFCDLADIDIIVTDTGLSQEWADIIEKHNIKLYTVEVQL